ncbi:amino acid adenylation domain-containing protein [Pedobacter sp. PLR]|uniref:polyketide synthase n=1 Tax=Pedobacter sp. PLR TaxID=2994465 RepID=UPI0022482B2E|nr:polyketide synthase [Pedobacter sp. PLR]MCX2449841.1 amino acid adenylation domain-containing protein [Pedobacter sp. PLR]
MNNLSNFSDRNTILDLFAEQVKSVPHQTAVLFEGHALSYQELDQISNRLAHYLIRKGIQKETLVPICLNNPESMLISILAVFKAGAAYVPIDEDFPLARMKYMVQDSAASLVITDLKSLPFLTAASGLQVILADEDWTIAAESPDTAVQLTIDPDQAAYVIYTSGSTGLPKGVLIEHHSLTDYVLGLATHLPLSSCKNYAVGATMATDLGNTAIFSALTLGGTLHLFSKENFNTPEYIHPYFRDHTIDCLKIVPSHWKSLALDGQDLMPQQLLIFGGEALSASMVKEINRPVSNTCRIVNHYGPTETTIGKLLHLVNETTVYDHTIPIGKPFTNAKVYILNPEFREAAVNEPGEIYIGGAGLARGYLNRPDLTAERFVKDFFSEEPGARLYLTGDLGKKREDGEIEYLGRIDDQVKIRGYRIELGEIESILQTAPGIKQGVILARENKLGDKRLIAYVVVQEDYDKKTLISYLESKLPGYMVPQLIVPMEALPFSPNGKVDKKALPDPDAATLLTNTYEAPNYETENNLSAIWKEILGVSRVGIEDNFFELGGNSLLAQKSVALLKTRHGLHLLVTRVYQFPRIKDIAAFLDGKDLVKTYKNNVKAQNEDQDIAVIGMSGRFPGADSVTELWELLKAGKESTRFFTEAEIDQSVPAEIRNHPDYVKARGIIEEVQGFDAGFFGITPKLAELMDPQQRIFLEIAWQVLEKTGYTAEHYEGRTGVFAGVRVNTYYANNVLPNPDLIENVGRFQVVTVNDKDYVSTRTAYTLNLNGPAVNVQSACSTSLLAVAQAVQSIRAGQCEMALAGGATINAPVNVGHLYEEGAMLSNDGHCRPFDAGAEGTVFSDGAGVVLLKNKAAALRDGDLIYALIKGVGISNDGGGKGSFTAPSAEGQAAAIRMAIDDAGVDPAQISYIETHGTATPLGDPIEIEGLNLAFGKQKKKQYCAIGSVKSNFGHLTCAAGVTGLIKASLAMHHQQIPASINYEKANPNIDFEDSPFIVNTDLKDWKGDQRLAGVSSFGVGGTNVHLILESYTDQTRDSASSASHTSRPLQLITWSAKNEQSLNQYGEKLVTFLNDASTVELPDIAYTLNQFRKSFPFRRFVLASDLESLKIELQKGGSLAPGQTKKNPGVIRETVFTFPGQGAQFPGMGKALYDQEPVFRAAMDECNALLKSKLQESLLDIIYPPELNKAAEEQLKNTKYSQPALFMIGYALGKLWMSWGVYPSAFIGHSIGEFVAAHFAGVLDLTDALNIIATRGQLMSELPGGSMLSAREKAETLRPLLPEDVAIAAINSPDLCVLAGTDEAIAAFTAVLNEKEIANRLLHTSHAFHSYMMDPVLEPFTKALLQLKFNAPRLPIYSTVKGRKMTDEEATDPGYWANHLRSTVLFDDAAALLLAENQGKAFIEMGPGNATATFLRQQPAGKNNLILSSLEMPKDNESAYHSLLRAYGALWLNGYQPDWAAFYKEEKRIKLTNLPTYAFNKTKYWVQPPASTAGYNATLSMAGFNASVSTDVFTPPVYIEQPFTSNQQTTPVMRKQSLISQIKDILENTSGIDMQDASSEISFIEMGLDSLLLTQIAIALKKSFNVPVTFRQLNEEFSNLDQLASYLDQQLPPETASPPVAAVHTPNPSAAVNGASSANGNHPPAMGYHAHNSGAAIELISQQIQLLARQVALLQGNPIAVQSVVVTPPVPPAMPLPDAPVPPRNTPLSNATTPDLSPEELAEIKKPFGASPKIEKQSASLTQDQQQYLDDLIVRYTDKTKSSKTYTQENRSHMADPRVVSGFKPATKELVYSIVINKSRGSKFWDLDGNEYIDALNGFGSNMLGYQPDVIKNALLEQIEKGYEIGPQHELAGEVSKLICEFTDFDRSALCNTGSEAVLGAMRIARTVTGRSLIVAFTGSYHGIVDEVIVRGSKKLKSFPAAPGIMPEAVQNMLILDYGTDESLRIIKERADEIAAVLVEPVQSRRPEFQPVAFLKELRAVTENSGTALIFDEVISGFRFHPRGTQGMFDIKADLGTYGKVAGAGISIGIIAGKRKFMDALDGGFWQYGDDSVPEIGVTYFAGTFVRHPLALATAKASLTYMKEQGPGLQSGLNEKTKYIADTLNAILKKLDVPMFIAQFGSLWRVKFLEDYAYTELFFTLMRLKGIHILEGFSCFLTTAHSQEDIDKIITTFEVCLAELKAAGFIPTYIHPVEEKISSKMDIFNSPPLPNARLGKDKDGNPAWFIEDHQNPGKYLQVN